MKRRNTIQKDLVFQTVQKARTHLTAEEIYALVKKGHPTVGKGTIYRNLNILTEEGKIRKIEVPNGPDNFDYLLTKHYHVKCAICGKVFDVDMKDDIDLKSLIRDAHGMELTSYDILFKGICANCKKIGDEKNG